MTRKDFILIAESIRTAPLSSQNDRMHLAHHMADSLGTTNPNFKREVFIDACMKDH